MESPSTSQLISRIQLVDFPGIRLLHQIGTGGMSTIWKAYSQKLGQHVAVKVLNTDLSNKSDEIRAFREEERFMEEISHPGVVRAYDFNCCEGFWYFVMEYVDGYAFSDLLKRKGFIKESDCLLIGQSVASALDYAWNNHGIVHCDIKPENIMINSEGVVKLTDLGISHRFQYLDNGAQTTPEQVMGTPAYISPEQVYGDVELDCRADIYSLGATLYHLSTGRILFPLLSNDATMLAHCTDTNQADDPRHYRPELSKGFAQLLEVMLVKDREERIQSWQGVFDMATSVEQGFCFQPRETTGPSSIRLNP